MFFIFYPLYYFTRKTRPFFPSTVTFSSPLWGTYSLPDRSSSAVGFRERSSFQTGILTWQFSSPPFKTTTSLFLLSYLAKT